VTATRRTSIVVGAGLAGLTAAYRLQQAGWDVKVLERGPVVGGRVQTITKGGYLIDTGAGALFEGFGDYMQLASELSLGDDLVVSSNTVATVRSGVLHHLDVTRPIRSGVTTRLISLRSKLLAFRLAYDIARLRRVLDYNDLSRAAAHDTESAGEYCRRRLNAELDAYVCEPMLRGLVLTTSDNVSKLEFLSGLSNLFNGRLHNLRGGLNRFPQALASRLDVRLGSEATGIVDEGDGVRVTWTSEGRESTERCDGCVVAVPLHTAAALCRGQASVLDPLNRVLTYSKGLVVHLGLREAPPTPASVVQIPRSESATIALLLLDHNKAPDRTPGGHGLVSALWDQDEGERVRHLSDDAIVKLTVAEVERIFPGTEAVLDMTHVSRWDEVVPFTRPGCFKAQRAFKQAVDRSDRIQFAGDFLSTGGQNTAVHYGNLAARNLSGHAARTSVTS